jgi:hypothetical protein
MEPRKDVCSAGQSVMRESSSSGCTASAVPEYSIGGTVKPVLNYSIQTGEEFALEFMRDRAIPKKHVPGIPQDQQATTSGACHKDSKGSLGAHRTRAETRFDAAIFLAPDNQETDVVERKPSIKTENRSRYMSTMSVPRPPSGGGSSHGLSVGYASSEASDTSRRLKVLCSFGGKILARPSDGKLRYVGGETRIIRVSRNISWRELKLKTTAIYNQPHVIKYQLPGEDLDALISVSNDEDLRNMMEECSFLDGEDGSQKLRIFIVSSIEFDDMSFSLGSMDSDSGIQYVAAINGMDGGAAKPSIGHGLATSINEFDQFINLNIDSGQTNLSRDSSNLHPVNASNFMPPPILSRPMVSDISGGTTANLHSYPSHEAQHLGSDDSYPTPSERLYDIESQMSIPLSAPSDYRYATQYAPYSGTASLRSFDQQYYQEGIAEGSSKEEKWAPDKMPDQNKEVDYFQSLENLSANMTHHDPSVSNYMHSGVPTTASGEEGFTSSLQPSDSAKSLETYSALRARSATQGSEISEDDRQSSEAFVSGCSDFQVDMMEHSYKNPPPHSGRVFHSEQIPREQAGFLDRLSKSDDSINPQFLILQSQTHDANEHTAESIDPTFNGTETSNLMSQEINLNNPVVDDSLIESEKEFVQSAPETSAFGEQRSSNDINRNQEKVTHAAEKVVAKGKLNAEPSHDGETTNNLGSCSTVTHHVGWDASNPALATDIEHEPAAPASTLSMDVSHKESVIPKTQNKDIAATDERTSPDILSDFFANSAAQSFSPFIDPVHSLNMPNYKPQRWSFFRNLAQNEFPHKDKGQDLAKIEEGAYPLAQLEHDTPDMKNLAHQNDFHMETHPIPSQTNVDSSILPPPPGLISTQADNLLLMKNIEGFQVDNPYTNMHEMMPSLPEFEVCISKKKS